MKTTLNNPLIGIATYKRPAGLAALLNSILEDESAQHACIVVVDNDPAGSAADVVGEFPSLHVTYVAEPRPGIAAVRNRALDHALQHGFDALVFVDDDEYVSRGWLKHLRDAADKWRADVTCGPVLPVVPNEAPSWIRWGGFFDRPRAASGGPVRWPATNNVLIRLPVSGTDQEEMRFSEDFSLTGGSDTDFFYRLRERGARFAWCDEAHVWETVPLDRACLPWLWRRGTRLGNVSARMMSRRHSLPYVGAIAVGRIVAALPLTAISLAFRRSTVGSAAMQLPKGVGMLKALRGDLTVEYDRLTPRE